MKNWISLLVAAKLAVALVAPHHAAPESSWGSLVVSTTSGRVHGKIDPALPNVRQFLGVPYAVPPLGDRRWTAPQLLSQPQADVDATELPPSCMQFLTDLGNSLYVRSVLQFNLQGLNRTGSVSEDCLTLSVWTPTLAASGSHDRPRDSSPGYDDHAPPALPVLIFMYGGGFATGGEDVPYQIPTQWVNRTPDHLVVSFNYRVNIFGFPDAAGLDEQNYGLLDQRAAVEWCRQNIAAFGGDPDRMVLWGQSAGSISVDFYNFAYPTDPIVAGLIMDSGTAESGSKTPDPTHANFTFVADHVGCDGLADDAARQLACMRGVKAGTIEGFLANYSDSRSTPALAFAPLPDDKVVFANYTERALAGQQARIPAIVGTNAQDGVAFAPYNPAGPNQTIAEFELLSNFFCPATETIRLRQQTGRLTYRYLYSGNFTNVSPLPWEGAYHSSELTMLMGTHPDFRGPSTPLEFATSHAFQDAYVAFAADPSHGLAGQDWTPYARLGAPQVRNFGAGVPAQDVSIAATEAMCDGAKPLVPL